MDTVVLMHHVEEMSKNSLDNILDGKKKAEVVFRRTDLPPYNCIRETDQIFFQSKDGFTVAKADVTKVENFKNLDPKAAKKLLEDNKMDLVPTTMNLERDIYFKYATVFWFSNLQELKPFTLRVNKDQMGGWIQIADINSVKKLQDVP